MAFEQKEGQGSLFRNEKTKDSQPDYTGTLLVGGVLYRVAGWIKEGRSGKFMSLKAEEKTAAPREGGRGGQYEPAPARTASHAGAPFPDSGGIPEWDIPF